ncbi:hypothetical protein Q4508_11505 [Amphritea sp. 2_MG-2023]|uniref:hypothetical protein n=1 Tax=Amphritea TaxID=515417 RepID=UPI001C0694EE|nr:MULTISPECIES: hypothetical protein [Amphritea]MBU2963910.1 hypothetical protein [Amphritea atlantica]MDO6419176.1 hypothetical protein [Amphritea sp. 2_MG-2023]MDX2423954.1 hypothetical protein [Amphritea sp.]
MQIERLEQLEQRIETYTSSLTQAVNEGRGAQFSMLLSLINATEDQTQKTKTSTSGFSLPAEQPATYPDPDSLYTDEVVSRLNSAVSEDHPGDLAYLLSHLSVQANTPNRVASSGDDFARMGLASAGRLMIDQIDRSGQQFSAQA